MRHVRRTGRLKKVGNLYPLVIVVVNIDYFVIPAIASISTVRIYRVRDYEFVLDSNIRPRNKSR